MTKVLLIAGFVLTLSTLGFAAANAGAAAAPDRVLVNGQAIEASLD